MSDEPKLVRFYLQLREDGPIYPYGVDENTTLRKLLRILWSQGSVGSAGDWSVEIRERGSDFFLKVDLRGSLEVTPIREGDTIRLIFHN